MDGYSVTEYSADGTIRDFATTEMMGALEHGDAYLRELAESYARACIVSLELDHDLGFVNVKDPTGFVILTLTPRITV